MIKGQQHHLFIKESAFLALEHLSGYSWGHG